LPYTTPFRSHGSVAPIVLPEHAVTIGFGHTGAGVRDGEHHALRYAAHHDGRGATGRRMPERVLQQVPQHLVPDEVEVHLDGVRGAREDLRGEGDVALPREHLEAAE